MWWSSPNDPASRLSWYWNARGSDRETAAHQAGLDPSLLETIELLHTIDDAHDPAPAVLDRMERTLMNTIALSPSRYDTVAVSTAGHNGRMIPLAPLTPSMPLPRARERRQGLFGAVATAAIVVLVVVASLAIVHPDRRAPLAPAPVVLPAVSSTPATDEAVTAETLLETEADNLPEDHAVIAVERMTLQPGSPTWILPPMDGLVIVTVQSGEIVATHGKTETPLARGEPFSASQQEVGLRAAGPEEATALAVYVISAFVDATGYGYDPLVHRLDRLIETSASDLPGGTARLVVERLTLAPGGALSPEEARAWVWTEVGDGALGLTLEGEQLPFRWKSGAERTFRSGQYLPPIRPGTRMTFRNAGDDPLVLYRLTLAPTDGAATPAT